MQMIKTAIEETRFIWWRSMLFACMRIYRATGSRLVIETGARYASRIEGYLELKRMDEEEADEC